MQQFQQYGGRNLSRQSAALQTPLPIFQPPEGQRGQDIMIIWDFQNVRTPTELEPTEIIRCVLLSCCPDLCGLHGTLPGPTLAQSHVQHPTDSCWAAAQPPTPPITSNSSWWRARLCCVTRWVLKLEGSPHCACPACVGSLLGCYHPYTSLSLSGLSFSTHCSPPSRRTPVLTPKPTLAHDLPPPMPLPQSNTQVHV